MTIELPPQVEALIREQVDNGRFASAEEVIAAAVRVLSAEDHRLTVLRSLLIEAEAETARGDLVEWTPELRQTLREEAAEMTINVSSDLAEVIRTKVDAGLYETVDDVIAEALTLLEQRDRREKLRAAIAIGDAQIARGEGIEWTPTSMDRLRREAADNVRQGKPIKIEINP